jgi:uncharacterized membrane protein
VIARWWRSRVVGDVHHEAVITKISAESGWSGAYLFAIVISAGISILGLLLPSSAVLIGAMLISPLMMPIRSGLPSGGVQLWWKGSAAVSSR